MAFAKTKRIANCVKELNHSEFMMLLEIMDEEWGQILNGNTEPPYIDKVRADLERLPFIPRELIPPDNDDAIIYFVAKATERALDKENRR